jgi:deoxyribose-phosphate aldolase
MDLHKVIEHTCLRPDCTLENIRQLCIEAAQYQFYGVCVPPYFAQEGRRLLQDDLKLITVIGFPFGYSMIPAKVEEIKRAIDDGADEIDAVINISAVKSGQWNQIRNEMDSMSRAVSLKGKVIKLIIETGLLTQAEIEQVLTIAEANDIHFIKTSTGVGSAGANAQIVQFIRERLSPKIKIKASGGIKSFAQTEQLLAAGADRIGTSHSVTIMTEAK